MCEYLRTLHDASAGAQQVDDLEFSKYFFHMVEKGQNASIPYNTERIHLIRVPKASSSSLSTVARRIAGCEPYGPCCKFPGDPPGSCPTKGLFACHTQGHVIGCTGHNSNYPALLNPTIKSITMLREPYSRAVSAFFYGGSQHNNKCTRGLHLCFLEYTSSSKWKNPAVKLLTGGNAYANERICRYSKDCRSSLELAVTNLRRLHVLGISEMWELSMLLLHKKIPSLKPLLIEFQASSFSSSSSSSPSSSSSLTGSVSSSGSETFPSDGFNKSFTSASVRVNQNEVYKKFRQTASIKYATQLQRQNGFDLELYKAALIHFCEDLIQFRLWENMVVRKYWRQRVRVTAINSSDVTIPCF